MSLALPAARRAAGPGAIARLALGRADLPEAEPNLEDILAERPPPLLRGPHYVIVLLFVTILLVASVVRVDMIVAASGRLAPDGPPIVLQPLERAVIRDIRVKVGDTVHKGDVLATLDPTFTQADRASLAEQQRDLQAQMRRLQAELDGTPLAAQGDTPEEQLQLNLYQQRRAQYAGHLSELDEEIKRDQSEIRATEEARALVAHQLDVAREIEDMRAKLYQAQYGSKLVYLEAQAARGRAEQAYQELVSKAETLQHTLRSAEQARQVYVDEWRRALLDDMAKVRTGLTGVSEALVKAERLNDLVELTAPQDGVVLDVAKRSVGSVLHEAEPLVTLVPSNTPLIVEVNVQSADVGYVKLGDEAEVKVDAFPYQRHGMLKGRLRSIAEDSFSPTTSEPGASPQPAGGVYHRSQVALESTALRDLPDGARLIPGMTATAEIKVGSRTVLSYFIYPLRRGLSESIREP